MTLPFTEQQCFFVAIFAFIVAGFYRGWRREVISLVFILLGIFIAQPATASAIGAFLDRLPALINYLLTGTPAPPAPLQAPQISFGVAGTLLLFALIVALGYYVGNRAFPKPATPAERFIGVVPALISGAAVLYYLNNSSIFTKNANGQENLAAVFQIPDPAAYVPLLFLIALIAVIVALISNRTAKKSAPPAKK
jgi:hypothetical protein